MCTSMQIKGKALQEASTLTKWHVVVVVILVFAGCVSKPPAPTPPASPAADVSTQSVPLGQTNDLPPSPAVVETITDQTSDLAMPNIMEIEVFDIPSSTTILHKSFRCRVSAKNKVIFPRLAVSSDLKLFAFNLVGGGIYVLDGAGKLVSFLGKKDVSLIQFTPDGRSLLLKTDWPRSGISKIRLSDSDCQRLGGEWARLSGDGKRVADMNDNKKCVVRDLDSGRTLVTSTTYYGRSDNNDVKTFAISDDGSVMVAAYEYSTEPGPAWIQVWNVDKRQRVGSFSFHDYINPELGWNGHYLVMDRDIWDLSDGNRYIGEGPDPSELFSAPDQPLAIKTRHGEVKSVNPGLWLAYNSFPSNNSKASPDGKFIWSDYNPNEPQKIRRVLWDLSSNRAITSWDGPNSSSQFGTYFTPDFKKVFRYTIR